MASYGINKGDFNAYIGGRYNHTDGWRNSGFDDSGTDGSGRFLGHGHSFAGQAQYKNLTANFFEGYTEEDSFSSPQNWPLKENSRRKHFIDLGYVHDFSERWSTNLNVSYTGNRESVAGLGRLNMNDWFLEGNVSGQITDDIQLIAGGSRTVLQGKNKVDGSDWRTHQSNVYVQSDWRVTDWLKLTGGMQVNAPEGIDRGYSPRAGAIFTIDKNWGAKLLYGKAFRAAAPSELFVNITGFIIGNTSIKPETIETYDAQIFYRSPQSYYALTAFQSRQEDTIALLTANGTPFTWTNTNDPVDSYGLTFEAEHELSSSLDLFGSMTYQRNKTVAGTKDYYSTPNLLVKTGFTWKPVNGTSLDVFNFFSDAPSSKGGVIPRKPLGTSHILSANVNVNIGETLDKPNLERFTFSLSGTNLLDQDTESTHRLSSTVGDSINRRPSRAVYGKLSVKF